MRCMCRACLQSRPPTSSHPGSARAFDAIWIAPGNLRRFLLPGLLRRFYAPRRVQSIGTCPIDTNSVTRRIDQSGFAPQPRLIARLLLERDTVALQLRNRLVQKTSLEINDRAGRRLGFVGQVNGKRAVAVGTLEASVMWRTHY